MCEKKEGEGSQEQHKEYQEEPNMETSEYS